MVGIIRELTLEDKAPWSGFLRTHEKLTIRRRNIFKKLLKIQQLKMFQVKTNQS